LARRAGGKSLAFGGIGSAIGGAPADIPHSGYKPLQRREDCVELSKKNAGSRRFTAPAECATIVAGVHTAFPCEVQDGLETLENREAAR
jgi:hypothetical protein